MSKLGQNWSHAHHSARTFTEEHDVIKQVEDLWGRLQQSNKGCRVCQVGIVAQVAHYLVGGGGVQACGDLVLRSIVDRYLEIWGECCCFDACSDVQHHGPAQDQEAADGSQMVVPRCCGISEYGMSCW